MALNQIGKRGKYKYIMDDGQVIKLRLDKTYGDLAPCGLSALTTGDDAGNKPTNFQPRVVFWQSNAEVTSEDGTTTTQEVVRRSFVCAVDSAAYTSVDNYSMTVDGVAGQTTGRRGEQITF